MQWGAIESTMFSDHFCIVIEHFLSGGMYHENIMLSDCLL